MNKKITLPRDTAAMILLASLVGLVTSGVVHLFLESEPIVWLIAWLVIGPAWTMNGPSFGIRQGPLLVHLVASGLTMAALALWFAQSVGLATIIGGATVGLAMRWSANLALWAPPR